MSVMAFESPGAVTETCKHAAAVLRLTNNLRISEASPEIFIHGENNNELWRAFVVFTVICEKERGKKKKNYFSFIKSVRRCGIVPHASHALG